MPASYDQCPVGLPHSEPASSGDYPIHVKDTMSELVDQCKCPQTAEATYGEGREELGSADCASLPTDYFSAIHNGYGTSRWIFEMLSP